MLMIKPVIKSSHPLNNVQEQARAEPEEFFVEFIGLEIEMAPKS